MVPNTWLSKTNSKAIYQHTLCRVCVKRACDSLLCRMFGLLLLLLAQSVTPSLWGEAKDWVMAQGLGGSRDLVLVKY